MNRLAQIASIALLFSSCMESISENQRIPEWLAVRESSEPADYINYIQSEPDSKYLWDALTRYWFLIDSINDYGKGGRMDADINWNGSDKYIFNGTLCDVDSLRLLSFEHLLKGRPEGSPHETVALSNNSDSLWLSKGRFEFAVYRNEIELPSMQLAIKAVSEGIADYRDHISKEIFQKPYNQLQGNQKAEIDFWIGDRLNFYDFRCMDRKPFLPLESGKSN